MSHNEQTGWVNQVMNYITVHYSGGGHHTLGCALAHTSLELAMRLVIIVLFFHFTSLISRTWYTEYIHCKIKSSNRAEDTVSEFGRNLVPSRVLQICPNSKLAPYFV